MKKEGSLRRVQETRPGVIVSFAIELTVATADGQEKLPTQVTCLLTVPALVLWALVSIKQKKGLVFLSGGNNVQIFGPGTLF